MPHSRPTWKPPDTRTAASAASNPLMRCFQYGQKYMLPASVDISRLRPVARVIAQAAKDERDGGVQGLPWAQLVPVN